MARTIQSPGVEINEVDLSLRPVIPVGTTVLIPGFASQGPTDEVFEVTSFSEFETVYGKPTNAAERYFYQTTKAVFNSDARVLTTRLPYGAGAGLGVGDDYTALFYPVYPYNDGDQTINQAASGHNTGATGASLSAATGGYIIGKPTLISLEKSQYDDLRGGDFDWTNFALCNKTFTSSKVTWGHAGMVVINKAKTTINDKYEGYYVGIADNSQFNPATNFDSILSHVSVSENSSDLSLAVPSSRRNFALSGTETSNDGSISETMENIPSFDISSATYNDTLTMGVFKLRSSVFATDTVKLDYVLAEAHVGSLDAYRLLQNSNGGNPQTFFLGNVEDKSANIEILVNPWISTNQGTWIDSGSNNPSKNLRVLSNRAMSDASVFALSGSFGVHKSVLDNLNASATFNMVAADVLTPIGTFQASNPSSKVIGGVPTKLSRVFRTIENVDAINIDLSVEAGLGTIFAGSEDNQASNTINPTETFDDERVVNIGTYASSNGLYKLSETLTSSDESSRPYNVQQNYLSVFNEFKAFAEDRRKDHLFIADVPRYLLVQGKNQKILDDKTKTFTQAVYWPLRHIFGGISSSFAATYGNWGRVYDGPSDRHMWAPFSGFAAATMANSDATYAQWFAPAGFTRGRFSGVNDLAVLPTQKHRDQLYKIAINPIHQFPNEGMCIWGQKTLFKNPSAFDRINVRRLFLYLEKLTRQTMKFYVFEPNTLLTRTQVSNNLSPVFNNVKNTQGMYDFLIICDERNNTPDRIDQNELIVDIYIKPVRAAEFILVNFYATRTGQDFNELIS
jgi:hypothetical protein